MALNKFPTLTDVEYWRARAEEARATADTFTDPNAKASMLSIAASYERIAVLGERAQGRAKLPEDGKAEV